MKRTYTTFAAALSLMGILLAGILNYTFTPGILWAQHAAFALLWWPLAMHFFVSRPSHTGFAVAGSLLTTAYLIAENILCTPALPWFLYACFPVLLWPVLIASGKRVGKGSFALCVSALTVAYYAALNVFLSPAHPWSVYIGLTLLWWPMTLHYARRRQWIRFAEAGFLLITVSCAVINAITTPGVIWAIYPAFAALWWPMSLYIALRRQWLRYALTASLVTILFFIAINRILTPGVVWAIYPVFAVLWWPLSLYFARKRNWLAYALFASLLTIIFFAAVNYLVSPHVVWAVYPAFAVLWWPLSVYYFHVKKQRIKPSAVRQRT